MILVGCPDNGGSQSPASGASSGASSTGNGFKPFTGSSGGAGDTPTGSGTAAFINIQKAVRSNLDPNSLIELIGSGGDIGTNCPTIHDCHCLFQWSESTGVLRQSETELVRTETDLARCPFNVVSPDAKFFDVTLKILAANLTSNTIRVFMPTLNPSLDPSIGANYLQVQRYMCRDIPAKNSNTHLYKNNLVDPQLWDKSLAFTFYTTSLGLDYGAINPPPNAGGGANVKVVGFECPPIPNDPSDNAIYDYKIFSLGDIKLDTPNSTNVPDGTGDNTIFPADDNLHLNVTSCPTGTEPTCEKFILNRHDFYLATFKSGVFKEPFAPVHKVANRVSGAQLNLQGIDNATVPLTLDTIPTILGGPRDVIGFAAVPDANQHCPDPTIVKLPPGKKWAKLWRFRTSFDKRRVPDISNADQVGDLFCTTREQECAGTSPGGNMALGASGASAAANEVVVNTVCYNARVGTGPNIGDQVTPTIGGTLTDPGFGNCDENGAFGDGNGNISDSTYFLNSAGGTPQCKKGDYAVNPNPAGATSDGGKGIIPGNPSAINVGCLPATPGSCQVKDPNNPGAILFNCCTDVGNGGNGFDPNHRPANYTQGGQHCNPALIGQNDASSKPFIIPGTTSAYTNAASWPGTQVGGLAQDVWLMGNTGNKVCIEADTDQNGKLADVFSNFPPAMSPNPFQPTPKFLDSDSQSDVIYVVTPETITVEQMQDPEHSQIARQYTPYRLLPNSDASVRQIYNLELIGSSNPNSPVPGERLSHYPICVLQDTKQGQRQGDVP